MTGKDEGPSDDSRSGLLQAVSEWVRFADVKAGAVLVLVGLLLTDALNQAGELQRAHDLPSRWGDASTVLWWVAMLAAASAVVCVSGTLFPRIKAKSTSLVFFGDIAKHETPESYAKALARVSFAEETTKQVWEVSRIAASKYRLLRWSYLAAVLFLISYAVARICYWRALS